MQNRYTTIFVFLILLGSCNKPSINRYELLNRHNVEVTEKNPLNSLTVGNGEFAYTVDITGMQSFPGYYEKGIPLGTFSNWGWHSFPNPEKYSLNDVYKLYKVGPDTVSYVFEYANGNDERKVAASLWLRENPHRMHLGILGLEFILNGSTIASINDIEGADQQLNLWTGEIISKYKIYGVPVEVVTSCHQDLDMISVRIKSGLLKEKKIKIKIIFPYATHNKFTSGCDFSHPEKQVTEIVYVNRNEAVFKRNLDNDEYFVKLTTNREVEISESEKQKYCISPVYDNDEIEISCLFSKDNNTKIQLPLFAETERNNKREWKLFWERGGAVDFSQCTDPRAFELERRVVLSQYLTKVQCSGAIPPQETGLTYNSWYGKFHMEMHWWHGIHFILWNRPELVEKQLEFYTDIFEKAKGTAQKQGYEGVRWPKMISPDGSESPSTIGSFLIWQQPHIVYFAELLYKNSDGNKRVLEEYKKLVFATADFMASYARYDSVNNRYILGPALIPAQERFDPETTLNPAFELAYWYWGLQTAQRWRERLRMKREEKWQDVIDKLSVLPVQDSLYLFSENATDTYTNPVYLTDHPIVTGILGFLPETNMIDRKTMEKTSNMVTDKWQWNTTWGWDFPLLAMNLTMLNKPELAIDILMMETQKNSYLINGHNYQDDNLSIYLPGNGGLLSAVAFICTYTSPKGKNGFPDNGKWNVKYENLSKLHR